MAQNSLGNMPVKGINPSGNKINSPKTNVNSSNKPNSTISSNSSRANQENLARTNSNKDKLQQRAPSSSSKGLTQPSSNNSQNLGKSSSSSGLNSSSNKNKTNSNRPKQETQFQKMKRQLAKEGIKMALASQGVPTKVTDKILNSKLGDKMVDQALNNSVPGLLSKPAKLAKLAKDNATKTLDEKSEEKTENDIEHGEISFEFSLKTIKWLVIITPLIAVLLFFLLAIEIALSDDKTSSMILAGVVSDEESSNIVSAARTGNGSGEVGASALGKGDEKYPKEYYERLSKLGNVYSTQQECEGKECLSRPEFMYYLKIADISQRYKNKYNVNLDWYLLSASNLYFSKSTEEIMKANLGGYDENTLNDYNTLSGLDWDNDYKNIGGYTYLSPNDSTYDLQILAKNMVKKKTTQTCSDSSGNIVKTQEDEDVEDVYLQSGGNKRLNCPSGQKYAVSSTYTLDKDKFDEFLLEYIDKKILKGNTKNNSSNSDPLSCSSSNSEFWWPIGSDEQTNGSNGVKLATGEPVSIAITSHFGSKEGFRVTGHGAIDISSAGYGAGKVNVIAAKSGTVVYPTSSSQTGFSDNGYLNNKDGGGYGNYVIIDHGDNVYTLYGHLAKDSITVMAGDKVTQGQVIGKLGHSGSSTGPHLHFEMRDGGNSSQYRVDPLNYVDPSNPRPNGGGTNECSKSNNMSQAFVNLALEQKNDSSASGGEKYRKYMCSGCGYYAWCAAFVSWVIDHTEYGGQKLSDIINYKGTFVSGFMNNFNEESNQSTKKFYYNDNCSKLAGKNGNNNKYTPKEGDLIFFDWGNRFTTMPASSNTVSHIGIVTRTENGVVYTIEGNSSDAVKERSYNLNSCSVVGFGSWY